MKFFKLTVLASLCFALFLGLTACEKESDKQKVNLNEKTDIPITGAQIVPASPSPGTGKLSVSYDRRNKLLYYSLNWTGLTDSVIAIRINGPSPAGFSALNTAFTGASPTAFTTTPYVVIQQFTGGTSAPFKALAPSTGSFSGTLAVDGFKVKETDLLNNLYYVTIHTKTILPGSAPASLFFRWYGEIRAQIVFQ